MRAMSACSPQSATVGGFKMKGRRAPLCRVGRSNEPAKAGGAAVVGRASGFLETEACTPRDLAARLGCYVGSDEPPKPSRAKQEPHDLTVRPWEGQGTPRVFSGGETSILVTASNGVKLHRALGRHLCESLVDETFETDRTVVQIVGGNGRLVTLTKVFVGDVEGHENGEPEHVARRRCIGRGPHLLIDVSGKLG